MKCNCAPAKNISAFLKNIRFKEKPNMTAYYFFVNYVK